MPWYHDLAVVWKGDVASAVLQVVSTYEGGWSVLADWRVSVGLC